MILTPAHREFARRTAELAVRLGVVNTPTLDEAAFRLVDSDVAIDLFNPWHLTDCRPDPDEARLTRLLLPRELGEAGYLGRVDVVRRMLAAGADPNAPEPDGVPVLQRVLAAWVTTDLHLAVVRALFDAGLVVHEDDLDDLFLEIVGTEVDNALMQLIFARAS